MFDFQEKKNIRRFFYAKPTIVIIFAIIVLSVNSTYKMYKKAAETRGEKNISFNENKALEERKNELLVRIGELKTERGLEEEIRNKFRVVKSGEEVVIVVESKEAIAGAVFASGTSTVSWFDKVREWFTP